MPPRLLPLIVAPAILLPLALYAIRQRRVRGALWYAVLLVALAVWRAATPGNSAPSARRPSARVEGELIGVLMMPVAWAGFILDFVARDALVTRRVVGAFGAVAAALLALAWTDGSHHLFWGDLRLEGGAPTPYLWVEALVLDEHHPYLCVAGRWHRRAGVAGRAVPLPLSQARDGADFATVLPWMGNVLFLAGDELPGTVDPTPFLFACTAVLAAVAVFRMAFWTRFRRCATRASRSSATRW